MLQQQTLHESRRATSSFQKNTLGVGIPPLELSLSSTDRFCTAGVVEERDNHQIEGGLMQP